MSGERLRVLMFAEAVTLAHVARPIALARALDPVRYEVTLACDERYRRFTASEAWRSVALHSIPSRQFSDALARGAPLYDLPTLDRYVAEDRALIDAWRPDLVVGDFRLSLSVSARLARVPYLAIANAYWSPAYRPIAGDALALPVLPLTRHLPLPLAAMLFGTFRPLAFALHCRPMNQLRARHGLPSLGHDLRRVYTDADHHLVPDIEPLYPLSGNSEEATYTGPLAWSPPIDPPDWWHQPVPSDQRCVYLSLGSSGDTALLPRVLEALAELPVRVLVSTAGAPLPDRVPANARLAAYLPGDLAAMRSHLVICNGGSLATQQALAAGVPVLGIAGNMDQFLNMAPIVAGGAGRRLRADRVDVAGVREACRSLLDTPAAATAARRLQAQLASSPRPAAAFDAAGRRLLAGRHRSADRGDAGGATA